jgi:tetratricopeptide (TPR) repeat protein
MLTAHWLRWSSGLLALLLTRQPLLPAPPTLAQVRQAFTAAHPASSFTCSEDIPFLTLTSPHPVLACLNGDAYLTLYDGHRTTELTMSARAGSYLKFDVVLAGQKQPVGSFSTCYDDQRDEVSCFDLVLGGTQETALGKRGEARFISLEDSVAFTDRLRRALAGQDGPQPSVSTLNDTGYLLQRAGYPGAALRLLAPVVQRAPTRAVAYLNRGDVYWQLNRLAAAQADYRRYLQLVRTQHKDTTRVPTYVRLALRLPAQ